MRVAELTLVFEDGVLKSVKGKGVNNIQIGQFEDNLMGIYDGIQTEQLKASELSEKIRLAAVSKRTA